MSTLEFIRHFFERLKTKYKNYKATHPIISFYLNIPFGCLLLILYNVILKTTINDTTNDITSNITPINAFLSSLFLSLIVCTIVNGFLRIQMFIQNHEQKYLNQNAPVEQSKNTICSNENISALTITDFDNMEGLDFEYACADLLKKNNYKHVKVTQGSGDYGVDILAEKNGKSYAIQCKCYSKNIGNKAIQEVFSGRVIYNCTFAVVLTNRYFTKSAKLTAEKNQVILWDRLTLISLIKNAYHKPYVLQNSTSLYTHENISSFHTTIPVSHKTNYDWITYAQLCNRYLRHQDNQKMFINELETHQDTDNASNPINKPKAIDIDIIEDINNSSD